MTVRTTTSSSEPDSASQSSPRRPSSWRTLTSGLPGRIRAKRAVAGSKRARRSRRSRSARRCPSRLRRRRTASGAAGKAPLPAAGLLGSYLPNNPQCHRSHRVVTPLHARVGPVHAVDPVLADQEGRGGGGRRSRAGRPQHQERSKAGLIGIWVRSPQAHLPAM